MDNFVGRQSTTGRTNGKEGNLEVWDGGEKLSRTLRRGTTGNLDRGEKVARVSARSSPSCLSRLCFLCFFEPMSRAFGHSCVRETSYRRPPARVPRSDAYTANTVAAIDDVTSIVPLFRPKCHHGGASRARFEYSARPTFFLHASPTISRTREASLE